MDIQNKINLLLQLEKTLDDWDPIGVLQNFKPITYQNGVKGEYSRYTEAIIKIYLAEQSLVQYLKKLRSKLIDEPNKEDVLQIEQVAENILQMLDNYSSSELQEILAQSE